MKIVPVIKCRDMRRSLHFYTEILDFQVRDYDAELDSPVIDIHNGNADIQLSTMSGDGTFGAALNVEVDDVDELFAKYVRRGLDTSGHSDSPVHQGPTDQTWGSREFYVTDPDGNTLRFRMWR